MKGDKRMCMYKDRKEQRKVTETMNSLLLPMLEYLNEDTQKVVRRALCLLSEIEIEEPKEVPQNTQGNVSDARVLSEAIADEVDYHIRGLRNLSDALDDWIDELEWSEPSPESKREGF